MNWVKTVMSERKSRRLLKSKPTARQPEGHRDPECGEAYGWEANELLYLPIPDRPKLPDSHHDESPGRMRRNHHASHAQFTHPDTRPLFLWRLLISTVVSETPILLQLSFGDNHMVIFSHV